jgi:hypothetical protein
LCDKNRFRRKTPPSFGCRASGKTSRKGFSVTGIPRYRLGSGTIPQTIGGRAVFDPTVRKLLSESDAFAGILSGRKKLDAVFVLEYAEATARFQSMRIHSIAFIGFNKHDRLLVPAGWASRYLFQSFVQGEQALSGKSTKAPYRKAVLPEQLATAPHGAKLSRCC